MHYWAEFKPLFLAIYEEVFVNRCGCIFFPFSVDSLEKLVPLERVATSCSLMNAQPSIRQVT
jgi:hypothetical protein